MARKIKPKRVAQLQRRYLRQMGATPEEIRRYQPFLTAQIGAESNFTEGIGSPAGARDIAQFMPGTAKGYGVRLGDNRIKDDIRGQVRYMLPLLRKYGVEGALRAYNAGPGAIEASKGYSETNAYVKRIRTTAGQYRGAGGNGPDAGTMRRYVAGEPGSMQFLPGEDNSAVRQQLLQQYLVTSHSKDALLNLGLGLRNAQDIASSSINVPGTPGYYQQVAGGGGKASARNLKQLKGVDTFDGKKVAAWIKPILVYARKHGWKGTVNSGYRSDAEQKRIYDSGVRPAALPRAYGGSGSNHEFKAFPGGAVDVSDAETLSRILKRSKYRHLLVYAGAKDPVHFSHPHNGSY